MKGDAAFSGSVPDIYEGYLVPLIFEPYAADLARRMIARAPRELLEVAAGTGVVTRALSAALPDTRIVATDLHQAMLDVAARKGTRRAVEWRQADALSLPFPDGSFDTVVCQFGWMFFPDKPRGFAEARRVLRPGGVLVFNVWDTLAHNEFSDLVSRTVAAMFPADPPGFLGRTPYAYNDRARIERDVTAGGFGKPTIETVTARSTAPSARDVALGLCQGTPLRDEISKHGATALSEATDACERAIAAKYGHGPVDAKIQALVVTVER